MKVAIIGATGNVGVFLGEELLRNGHEVIGLNRRPERVYARIRDPRIRTWKGDCADVESIKEFLSDGCDVVVLSIAPTREHPGQYAVNNKNVIKVCKDLAINRLVTISNHISLRTPDGIRMLEAKPVHHPWFYNIQHAYEEAAQHYYEEKDLDWLLISPPCNMLPFQPILRKYRVLERTLVMTDPTSKDYANASTMSMEDFVYFVAEELEEHKYSHVHIGVGY